MWFCMAMKRSLGRMCATLEIHWGVKFYDDKANKFRAVSRKRKGNNDNVVETREGPK